MAQDNGTETKHWSNKTSRTRDQTGMTDIHNKNWFEPPRDKTNKMAFAPSEDPDQSDQSLRCLHKESLGP